MAGFQALCLVLLSFVACSQAQIVGSTDNAESSVTQVSNPADATASEGTSPSPISVDSFYNETGQLYEYVGCFPRLQVSVQGSPFLLTDVLTLVSCADACSHHEYFGVQDGLSRPEPQHNLR